MTYRLHYAMLLPVGNMVDAGGVDMSAEKLAQALEVMAQSVRDNPASLRNILGSPISAEIEDRWVMRSASEPNMVLGTSGVELVTKDMKTPPSFTSEEILTLGLIPGNDMLWCRPEDTGGLPVLMKIINGNDQTVGQLDLRDWMAWADPDDVIHHIADDWDFSPAIWDSGDAEYERGGRVNPLCLDANLLLTVTETGCDTLHGRILPEDRARAAAYLEELRPGIMDRASPGLEP